MSEWLKEHAWKLMQSAHLSGINATTSTTSRNSDLLVSAPANGGVCTHLPKLATALNPSSLS
jgi:hypothetical protein